MKSKIIYAILISSFVFASCTEKSEKDSIVRSFKYKESIQKAYKYLGIHTVTNSLPGVAIAVSIDNKIVWADAIGMANEELKVKAKPDMKYRIGGCTQLITALSAAKLYEEGKIDIYKPVREYLPDMPEKKYDFNIYNLATHSSGIRKEKDDDWNEKPLRSLKQGIETFINDSLLFEPGKYVYKTGLGYDLMGWTIEKEMKKSFVEIVKETVVDKLNLTSTYPDLPLRLIEKRVSFYGLDLIARVENAMPGDFRYRQPSLGYLSSPIDLVTIGNTLLEPGFLKQETLDLFWNPYKLPSGEISSFSYGGIVRKDKKGRLFYALDGNMTGGSSMLLIYPDKRFVISIVTNIKTYSSDLPIFELADIFMDQL